MIAEIDEELYKENILDHYKHPRNSGKIEHTHAHQEFNPLCGDKIEVFLQLEKGIVKNLSFIGEGCAISQASMSLLSEEIKGKTIKEVKKLAPWDIYNLLGIKISHNRSKCALLGLKTIQEGIRENGS